MVMRWMVNSLILSLMVLKLVAQTNLSERLHDPSFPGKAQAQIQKYIDLDLFSGVVLIADHGVPVYHQAFGMADRANQIPITTSTRFNIGSMNKAFTKVVILQLVSEGVLRLEDTLGKFLPDFPAESRTKVTVNQLLNHRSGFGDYHQLEGYWDMPWEEKTPEKLLEMASQLSLMFEPGTDQAYSNAGYVLLGAIAEKATGQSYFDLVHRRITEPLGMVDTYLQHQNPVPDRAIGYLYSMRGNLEDNEYLKEPATAAGGSYSTVADMLTFFQAYYYGKQLWDDATRQMDERYSYLQTLRSSGGASVVAGGFEGSNTVCYAQLKDQITILVFANMDEPVAENVGLDLLNILRGKEVKPPELPAVRAVYRTLVDQGIDAVRDQFGELTQNFPPDDSKDMVLNQVGYNLLYSDNPAEQATAVNVFRLNTELFPNVANGWDSLGEALLKTGDREGARKAYQRALDINPDLATAVQALKKLR
ncbi:MAG: serine hydrolase [Saprospiraceae bacterium]